MIAHFDAVEGASGDLILAALVDAGAPLDVVRAGLESLPIALPSFEAPERRVRGFRARVLEVAEPTEGPLRHLPEILDLLDRGRLPARALDRARRVFERLAEAEARCHGVAIEEIHFHEVGALDSILDIVGVALALEALDVSAVSFSPLGLGTGTIGSAHGTIPVPVPAVLELTRDVPVRRTGIPTEILTPTGAALLTTLGRPLGEETGGEAVMIPRRVGVAAGRREFPGGPSLLRVTIGETIGGDSPRASWEADTIEVLETNLDDLNPELLPGVLESALAAGALDVMLTPVLMKKGRPGHILTALAPPGAAAAVAEVLFRETSTLGVRRSRHTRWTLPRQIRQIESPWGPVTVKVADLGEGRSRAAPEHESLHAISRREGVPLVEVYEKVGELIRNMKWVDARDGRG